MSLTFICLPRLQTQQLVGIQPGKICHSINLKGSWSFSIGINNEWISPKFDDSDWETIKVPSHGKIRDLTDITVMHFTGKKLPFHPLTRAVCYT